MIIKGIAAEGLVALSVFIWLISISMFVPFMADDWCLMYQGQSQIFQETIHIYQNWTGRAPAHGIAMEFLALPKWVFNIANAACFTFLLGLMVRISSGAWDKPYVWAMGFALLLFGIPTFGESVLWVTGSANYLWTTTIIVVFVWPYVDHMMGRNPTGFTYHPWARLWWFPVALLAGWSNENTGPAAFIMSTALIVLPWMNSKTKPPRILLEGLVLMSIGIAFMLVAPGNSARLYSGAFDARLETPLIEHILRFTKLAHQHFIFRVWPLFLCLLLGWVFWMRTQKPELKKPQRQAAGVWIFGYILTVGALVLSPYVEPRAITGGSIFLAIAILLGFESFTGIEHLKRRVMVFCGILAACFALGVSAIYMFSWPQTVQQQADFARCHAEQTWPCVMTEFTQKANTYFILPRFAQPANDPKEWVNACRIKQIEN